MVPGLLGRDLPVGLLRSILRQAGYGAWAPDLPGCVALGDTVEDCERHMREAIAFHLEGLRGKGEPIPKPTAVAAVMVPTPAA
jgi:predicted RNase H-like HicB family nuclease